LEGSFSSAYEKKILLSLACKERERESIDPGGLGERGVN